MAHIVDLLVPPVQLDRPYPQDSEEARALLAAGDPDRLSHRVQRVAQVQFAPSVAALLPASKRPFLSERVHAGQDVATDLSFLGRTPLGSTALDATLGTSTGINAILGYNSYLKKTDQEEHARTVEYDEGVRIKQVDRARCAAQMVGGGLFFGIRALTLASYVKGVDTSSATAPTLLGRVTFVTSAVGSALWGLVYTLIAVVSGLGIYEAYQFRKELNAALESPEATAAFIRKWSGSNPDELERAVAAKGYSDEALQKEAIKSHAQLLKSQGHPGTERERRREALQLIQEDADRLNHNPREHLIQAGREWKIEKLRAMRDLKVTSLTSKGCADKLFGRAAYLDPEALLTEMKTAMDKNFWINLGYFVTCVIGVLATIGAFVLTGGLGPLIVTIGFLLVALMMTALDGYSLHDAIRSPGVQGIFDKHLLTISTGISFLSFVGSIILISVLSLGIVPLVGAIAIFLFWIGVNLKVWSALPPERPAWQQL